MRKTVIINTKLQTLIDAYAFAVSRYESAERNHRQPSRPRRYWDELCFAKDQLFKAIASLERRANRNNPKKGKP